MYSSVTLPRSAKGGAPIASNSSFIQPAPMPRVTRPPDSTSIVASCLAASTAGRCGMTMTEVTSRSLLVRAATNASSISCSLRSPLPWLLNSPVAL